jgi:hypothetical protein
MDTRHNELLKQLAENGWSVVRREQNDLDWWADEIWEIRSEWAPNGLTIFLTFLVDPQWDDHRKKAEGVWAVGTSLMRPTNRDEAEGDPLVPFKRWAKELGGFIRGLSDLRTRRLFQDNPPTK